MKPPSCSGCALLDFGDDFNEVDPKGKILVVSDIYSAGAKRALGSLLSREGLKEELFTYDAAIRCKPPGGRIIHSKGDFRYTESALAYCSFHLNTTIAKLKPSVIISQGAVGLRRLLGLPQTPDLHKYRGYWEWSEAHKAWIGSTYAMEHLQGNWSLIPVILFDINRAVDIQVNGYRHELPDTLCDPSPAAAYAWAQMAITRSILSTDIETPMKVKMDEDELENSGPDPIIRISFAVDGLPALSVTFTPEYLPTIRMLIESNQRKRIWNAPFDYPHLSAYFTVGGVIEDTMYRWHVWQPSLVKKLGWVAPFFIPNLPRWKHLGDENPALYNAIDSFVLHEIGNKLVNALKKSNLLAYSERHVIELRPLLNDMTAKGVPVDPKRRLEAYTELKGRLSAQLDELQQVVPIEAKQKKVYKLLPKQHKEYTTVLQEGKVKVCSKCGAQGVTKSGHTLRKRDNPCYGAAIIETVALTSVYAVPKPFVPSNVQMLKYAKLRGHKVSQSYNPLTEAKTASFDVTSLKALIRKYKSDPLYPKVLAYRRTEKLLGYIGKPVDGEWIGGIPVSADGRVHPTFNDNPRTMRLASNRPNINQIPRPDDPMAELVRRIFVAEKGCLFGEIDYGGIEAVLVGYKAGSERYVRIAYLGMHDFLNSYALHRRGKISQPADEKWSDADLKEFLHELKLKFPRERFTAKKTCHSGNYGITPFGLFKREPEAFGSEAEAEWMLKLYFDVFPELDKWQTQTLKTAQSERELRTPYGNLMRFQRALKWYKEGGEWKEKRGPEAEEALAFWPQSTAAGILKELLFTLRDERPDLLACVRFPNHDSLGLQLCPADKAVEMIYALKEIMERPISALPLPWDPSACLRIQTEAKLGKDWSTMNVV